MSLSIQFDYRFDDTGFFSDPARRSALEAAAAAWEATIRDEFTDVAAGTQFSIRNPSNQSIETITLDHAIDDILIFVGAQTWSSSTLAIAGPDGGDAAGDVFAARISPDFRGTGPVTDFEPWVGSITFNAQADWTFDLVGPVSGHSDFISVAIHEIGHVLGIGTSGAFDNLIIDDHFVGPNALRINERQPIPLEHDHAHVEEGFADDRVALDPILTDGARVPISDIDKAILADIGYDISGFDQQGNTPSITTNDGERVFGTVTDDLIDGLSGDDSLQGNDGQDRLNGGPGNDDLFGQFGNDTIEGGSGDDYLDGGIGDDVLIGGPGADVYFGHDGRDIFVIAAGDGSARLSDFDLNEDVVRLIDSGFTSPDQALDAISKPFSNVSRITLSDGTTVDVFHTSQSGTPLTPQHIQLESSADSAPQLGPNERIFEDVSDPTTAAVLRGTPANDRLIVAVEQDHVDGQEGVDTALFEGNQSGYSVLLSNDSVTVTLRGIEQDRNVSLDNVELIAFSDHDPTFGEILDLRQFEGLTALDHAARDALIELYIAYFNRAPDVLGLSFWATAYAQGSTLNEIAGQFSDQDETRAIYDEDHSTLRFVADVYDNVLGRVPDFEGLQFWSTMLEEGTVSRGDFIVELLNGVRAEISTSESAHLAGQQAEDQEYLALKTELGVEFALTRGMSDLAAASEVMTLFDGSDTSFTAATDRIDELYLAASTPIDGSFLISLVGSPADDMTF